MPQSINLIPQEERIEQAKSKVVKFSTILAVVILIIVGGVGGYFYYTTSNVQNEISNLDNDIDALRARIGELSEIEVNARNLYKKSNALTTIFDVRMYYSTLLSNLEQSTPDGITLDSFGLGSDSTIALSGRANTYNTVQDFTNRLLVRDLFTEVELKSVGLESRQDQVNFFIIVTYDEGLLHE